MWMKELRRLVVQGGFLDGLEINFQSGLNCIIGPRGTGKSSILSLIRFALGNWSAQPREFIQRMSGLLEDGQVEVEFITEFDNLRRIQRRIGRYPQLYDGEGRLLQEGTDIKFNLEAYHQGELEQLLDQGGTELMSMLDRTIEELTPLQRELEANAAKRIQLQRDYETAAIRLSELKEKVERKNLLCQELAGLRLNEPEKRRQALVQESALFEFWEKLLSSRLKALRNMLIADYHSCRVEDTLLLNPDCESMETFAMQVKVYPLPFLNDDALDEMGNLEVPTGATLRDVYKKLQVPLLLRPVLLCSVNYEKSSLDRVLQEGDVISFFFPITGG
jgi:molybdopterin converting factor small subunit/DNA repair ATPase RecN